MFRLQGNFILSDIGLAEKRIYHATLNGNNTLPSVLHHKDNLFFMVSVLVEFRMLCSFSGVFDIV